MPTQRRPPATLCRGRGLWAGHPAGRFIPIVAARLAAGLAGKRPPFTVGTLRTDTPLFGFVLLVMVLLLGAGLPARGGLGRWRSTRADPFGR
jgi:hypothetical protein